MLLPTFALIHALALPACAAPKKGVLEGANDHYEIVPPTSIPRGMPAREEGEPGVIALIVHPIRRGIFLSLPIIDTDPNRGITLGFMPIWVIKHKHDDRIGFIHAPSITRNKTFKWTPTYRLYYYPTDTSDLTLRGAFSTVSDREVFGQYHDRHFLGTDMLFGFKLQYNVDGSNRFFGLGPNTSTTDETNYIRDTLDYFAQLGVQLSDRSAWMAKFTHKLAGDNISNGPINTIPDITARYPGVAPFHRHQSTAFRAEADYDTRDNEVTTKTGAYAGFYAETSQNDLGSEYTFNRYGVDLREFFKTRPDSPYVTAGTFKFEQLVGEAPFWLLPQLGGKYTHRAYGEGRFIDKGFFTAQAEERFTFFKERMAGVTTEFELAPFAGAGAVFETASRVAARYVRPVFGAAVRAVARPQVVGSIDFGVGQEGLAVFMDINYSF